MSNRQDAPFLVLCSPVMVSRNSATFSNDHFAQLRSFPSAVVCAGCFNTSTLLAISPLRLSVRIKEKGEIIFSPPGIPTHFYFSVIILLTEDGFLRRCCMLDMAKKKLAIGKKLPWRRKVLLLLNLKPNTLLCSTCFWKEKKFSLGGKKKPPKNSSFSSNILVFG